MQSPNLLCVSIDSLRADYCSIINDEETTTPHLGELAEESTVFTNAISASTWTLQSHASIFTGLYPPEHQLTGGEQVLGSHPTLAELLQKQNYMTKSFGYNGWLEHSDILRGFEHTPTPPLETPSRIRSILSRLSFRRPWRDDQTVSEMKSHLSSESEPFFYFVHLNGTHHKYSPPAPYYRQFTQQSTLRLGINLLQQKKIFDRRADIYIGDYSPSDKTVQTMKNLYRGCIAKADTLVNEMVSALRTNGQLENTIIVVFGDHGESFGENNIFGHQFSVSDSLIRVPLLIYDPTETLASGHRDEIVQLPDLYPTLLELCGVKPPSTRCYNIREKAARQQAFVYYTAPLPFVSRIKSEVSTINKLPPEKQYLIWESPSQKLIWFPESGRTIGCANMFTDLMDHRDSLERIPPAKKNSLTEKIENNLRDMGYL